MRLPASREPAGWTTCLGACVAGLAMSLAQGAQLDINRLFEAPALAGPALSGLRIAADGSSIWYLRNSVTDANRLDLWKFDLPSGSSHRILGAEQLLSSGDALPPEELARRERQRTASLSGIVDYALIPGQQALLVPAGGRLYRAAVPSGAPPAITTLDAGSHGDITDATVSPRGDSVAYVSEQNLQLIDLHGGESRALTHDGGGTVSNGMAEFVAQEEMGRHTGYWWSPDGSHIAFARVDESAVPVRQRFEIAADGIATFAQRYPAAGDANASVILGVVEVASGTIRWLDLGVAPDTYLARVQWLPDSRTLAIQRESRDQRRLDLLLADTRTGHSRTVLTETSPSWIDLNDELTFLRHSAEFLWASQRDGHLHLYLYRTDGQLVRQVTAGDWDVGDLRSRAIKGLDERRRLVYFTADERSPLDRDLYVASLETTAPHKPQRITQEAGLHSVTMAPDLSFYVDRYTSRRQPPQVSVRNLDGSLRTWIEENRLDQQHPDAPYLAGNASEEFGTLRASDGQELFYRLFKPRELAPGRRYPAIVYVYGGPTVQTVLDDWSGDEFTQLLTRAGYVVFQLDNRGSANRGTAFQSPLCGQLGSVEVEDQVRGAHWLGTLPYVDAQRIGVWGWSYGGYMTLKLMFRAPDVFRAGISGAPVTDWSLYDTHYTERYLGLPQEQPQAYAASSVLGDAAALKGRLLLIHGMADDNVLFAHSTRLLHRLQELGKPFDVMVYPGAKHALLRQNDGRHAYATMLRFFGDAL